MSFVETLDNLALKKSELVKRFEHLIASKSDREFEAMAQSSRALTLQNFGRTMRLFAPLYLSNECINNCQYCGFSRDNPILRVTLDVEEVLREARHLDAAGLSQHPARRGRASEICRRRLSCAIACARCTPDFPGDLARSRADGNGGLSCRSSRRARKGWSFIRKPTIARFTRRCTPPGRNGISTGGSNAPSAPTRPDFAGSASARCSVWRDWRYEAIALAAHADYLLRTLLEGANHDVACRACVRARANFGRSLT